MTGKITNPIHSVEDYQAAVRSIAELRPASAGVPGVGDYQAAPYVWRGQSNAAWEVVSAVHREFKKIYRSNPTEQQLQEYELKLAQDVIKWGLDWHPQGGRLTGLDLLARMQHHGIPTRLIDVTSNPLVALWFAVSDPLLNEFHTDGVVFVWDARPEVPAGWAHRGVAPWLESDPVVGAAWEESYMFWSPPPLDDRIVRQSGSFVLGGVPIGSTGSLNVRYDDVDFVTDRSRVRRGRGPTNTKLVICRDAKLKILRDLRVHYGLDARNLFPDADGFRSYQLPTVSESDTSLDPDRPRHPMGRVRVRLLTQKWEYNYAGRLTDLMDELNKYTDAPLGQAADRRINVSGIICLDHGWVIFVAPSEMPEARNRLAEGLQAWAESRRAEANNSWGERAPWMDYEIAVEDAPDDWEVGRR